MEKALDWGHSGGRKTREEVGAGSSEEVMRVSGPHQGQWRQRKKMDLRDVPKVEMTRLSK